MKTHPDEPSGANVVRVGCRLLYAAGYPNTQATIEALGHDVRVVDMSELAKAEGALTGCSLLFNQCLIDYLLKFVDLGLPT